MIWKRSHVSPRLWQGMELVDDESRALPDAREFRSSRFSLLARRRRMSSPVAAEEAHRGRPARRRAVRSRRLWFAGCWMARRSEVSHPASRGRGSELRAPPVGGHLQVGPATAAEGLSAGRWPV